MRLSQRTKDLIKICALENDLIRENLPINWLISSLNFGELGGKEGGDDFLTSGITRIKFWNYCLLITPLVLNNSNLWLILSETQVFNNFNKDNDPYGEHDFGNFKIHGETYYFKFDYWENDKMEFGAENHLKYECYRGLTIMNSSEY